MGTLGPHPGTSFWETCCFPSVPRQLSAVSVRAHQRATLAQGCCLQRQETVGLGARLNPSYLAPSSPVTSSQTGAERWVWPHCTRCVLGKRNIPPGREDVLPCETLTRDPAWVCSKSTVFSREGPCQALARSISPMPRERARAYRTRMGKNLVVYAVS